MTLTRRRANAERNFQMAEAKWPVCKEEAKANFGICSIRR